MYQEILTLMNEVNMKTQNVDVCSKWLILLVLFFASIPFCFSQDVITKRNGEEIQAKILEVTLSEIKYKKAENPDGPIYSIAKDDAFMIKYANGQKDLFEAQSKTLRADEQLSIIKGRYYSGSTRINGRELKKQLATNPQANGEYELANNILIGSYIFLLPSAFIMGGQLGAMMAGGHTNPTVLLLSGFGTAAGLIGGFVAQSKIQKAVNIYNGTQKVTVNIKFAPNQFAIALNF